MPFAPELTCRPKSNRDAHGNLKKGKKKKKKHKEKSAKGLTEPGGLHCELRYSEVWGHGMEFQQLTDSTVDVMVDGSLIIPGDSVELTSKSLIVIGDTEILCDVVKHDMYKNFHRPAHLVSKESRIKDEQSAVQPNLDLPSGVSAPICRSHPITSQRRRTDLSD